MHFFIVVYIGPHIHDIEKIYIMVVKVNSMFQLSIVLQSEARVPKDYNVHYNFIIF